MLSVSRLHMDRVDPQDASVQGLGSSEARFRFPSDVEIPA